MTTSLKDGLFSEAESSATFTMLRSTPPGTAPIRIKPEYFAPAICYLLVVLYLINGLFYFWQGRYLGYIPSPSEISTDSYQIHLATTIYPLCGVILSLLLTIRACYIDLAAKTPILYARILRFLSIFISITLIFCGCLTVADSKFVHNFSFVILTISLIVYEVTSSLFLVKITPLLLTAARAIVLLSMLCLTIYMHVLNRGTTISALNNFAISEYIVVACILLVLLSVSYELSKIILDVVVIQDSNTLYDDCIET